MIGADWLRLIWLSFLWGGTFFFVEVALEDVPPLTLVFLRVMLAALALHIFIAATGRRIPIDMKLWGAFLVMGLLNNAIPFALIFWGQTEIAGSLAAILNATTPIWTVLLAHLLTADERLTPARAAGVALGFAGVVVMIGYSALAGLGAAVLAQLAVVAAAMCYALAGIWGRRFRDIAPAVTAAGQLTASSLLILPVVLAVDRPWQLAVPSWQGAAAIAALAFVCTAYAYILYFRILKTSGAVNLLLVTFLIPVTASFLGITILGEVLEARHIAGILLIAAGLAAIDGRPLRWLRRRVRAV